MADLFQFLSIDVLCLNTSWWKYIPVGTADLVQFDVFYLNGTWWKYIVLGGWVLRGDVCMCTLPQPHRAQPFMHVHGVDEICIKMQLSTWHLGYTWRFDLIKFHVPFWNLHFYIQQWDLNWKVFADLSFGDREVQLFPINLDSRVFTKRASDRANLDISRTISYRFCIPH